MIDNAACLWMYLYNTPANLQKQTLECYKFWYMHWLANGNWVLKAGSKAQNRSKTRLHNHKPTPRTHTHTILQNQTNASSMQFTTVNTDVGWDVCLNLLITYQKQVCLHNTNIAHTYLSVTVDRVLLIGLLFLAFIRVISYSHFQMHLERHLFLMLHEAVASVFCCALFTIYKNKKHNIYYNIAPKQQLMPIILYNHKQPTSRLL